jgi:serine protease Do
MVVFVRSFRRILALFVFVIACPASVLAAPPLPALPGDAPLGASAPATAAASAPTPTQGATSPAPAGPAPADPAAALEHARRGVVTIEQAGRVVGVGAVLSGDGRILTALSALGASETAEIRYADNSVVHAKVGHRDKAWDLALLVPLSGRWLEGLQASETDPTTVEPKVLVPAKVTRAPIPFKVKGRIDARSKEGDSLPASLDVDVRGTPAPGTPVIDDAGGVVAVLVHACKADAAPPSPGAAIPCAPTVVGAPVAALRHFLVRTPLNAVAPSAWLGIVGAPDSAGNVRGVRVMAVAPQSPAEKGGLKTHSDRNKADLIAAVDGHPVDSPEQLAEAIGKHAIGESVKLLVLGGEGQKYRETSIVLKAAP